MKLKINQEDLVGLVMDYVEGELNLTINNSDQVVFTDSSGTPVDVSIEMEVVS